MQSPLCLQIGAPGSEADSRQQIANLSGSPLLAYHADPVVGLPEDGRVWPSRLEFWAPGSEALLLEEDEHFLFQSYAPSTAQQTDARFRLMAADPHGLPPALVLTCGVDSLRDEGQAYAEKLKVSIPEMTA